MKLSSTRELAGLKNVLKDKESNGPDPVYWVLSEVSEKNWANITVIVNGDYNGECPKTFGHYHGVDVNETYHLIEGEGVLQLQKKHLEGGKWIPEIVDEVYLVKAKPGDEIVITPEMGHSWSNVGDGPIISYDNWRSGHDPSDYAEIERLQGLAYYLVKENGEIKAVKNPNYKNLPEPIWISAEEYRKIQNLH